MNPQTPLRRHADGSLDTEYYAGRGRSARSREAFRLLATISALIGWPRRAFPNLRGAAGLHRQGHVH